MNLYRLPPGLPPAQTLAEGLSVRFADDLTALGNGVIYLPSRRAARFMREAFVQIIKAKGISSLLLPSMIPLGDVDGDGLLESIEDSGRHDPPVIPATRRLMLLAKLLEDSGRFDAAPTQLLQMAESLAQLIDELHIAEKSIEDLSAITVDTQYARHWQRHAGFLQEILQQRWPKILQSIGMADAAQSVNAMLDAQVLRLQKMPPAWVLAAGSTGSRPVSARFLHAIMNLPQGEVVLPGLAADWDEAAVAAIQKDCHHPYHVLLCNLAQWGADVNTVPVWQGGAEEAARHKRTRVLLDAMRSAEMPPAGDEENETVDVNLHLSEFDDDSDEALAIALMMREGLEQEQKTVLVTADNALARRVSEIVNIRYGLQITPSHGLPMLRTAPARFLLLVAQNQLTAFADVESLTSLLQHPMARFGHARVGLLKRMRRLQQEARQGRRDDFVPEMQKLLGVQTPSGAAKQSLQTRLQKFIEDVKTYSRHDGGDCFSGDIGQSCLQLLQRLSHDAPPDKAVTSAEFVEILQFFIKRESLRPKRDDRSDLAILGSWEARMLTADRIIIGGLAEGVWPVHAPYDIWLNRAMRHQIGLPLLARRIGLAAHDFFQALHAGGEIYITRCRQQNEQIALESRFITRLKTAFPQWAEAQSRPQRWHRYLHALTQAAPTLKPYPQPEIAVSPERLPTYIAVTHVETLLRDPYAFYAAQILRLKRLPPLFAPADAARWGQFVHELLNHHTHGEHALQKRAAKLVKDYFAGIGQQKFAHIRLQQIIEFVSAQETCDVNHLEIEGEAMLTTPKRHALKIAGRADSIRITGKKAVIIDYKTGTLPTQKDCEDNLRAPQLPLLGLILQMHGFENVAAVLHRLEYWELKPRFGKSRRKSYVKKTDVPPGEIVTRYHDLLVELWDEYCAGKAFVSLPDVTAAPAYNDSAPLARHQEWLGQSRNDNQ